jgi:hypothetical protein
LDTTDPISDALPFARLWHDEPDAVSNAVGYAKFYSRSHDAVIHVYDALNAKKTTSISARAWLPGDDCPSNIPALCDCISGRLTSKEQLHRGT